MKRFGWRRDPVRRLAPRRECWGHGKIANNQTQGDVRGGGVQAGSDPHRERQLGLRKRGVGDFGQDHPRDRPRGFAGKPVGVLARTDAEISDVLSNNPFPKAPGNWTVGIFLDEPPPADALDRLVGLTDEKSRVVPAEDLRLVRREHGRISIEDPGGEIGNGAEYEHSGQTRRLAARTDRGYLSGQTAKRLQIVAGPDLGRIVDRGGIIEGNRDLVAPRTPRR